MIIDNLFLVKDKINIFDNFDVSVKILTYNKDVEIEMINKFKKMDRIEFLKKVVKIVDVIEYDNYIVMYKETDKKGFVRANGAFKRLEKLGINEDDTLDTKINILIKNKDKVELIWFDTVKINTTDF